MPSLDYFHPQTTDKTATDGLSIPVTSPDPATADTFVTSGTSIPRPTSATSTSTPPLFSTYPPAAVTLRHKTDPMAPSDPPNHPSLAPHPNFDITDPTECHRSAVVPLGDLTGPASAPELVAAAKDDGNPKAAGLKDRNIHSAHPSAIRAIQANTVATLDLPQPSPSLQSVTDMDSTIAGSSLHEPNTKRTGDLDPLHCPYDIV
ncbi:hypothetical protein EDB83DRAFT_2554515 [Lactarius deliciosus]|nr:hypothetical protein EDB83DRAFT_2554515 [Lactarius deliciosus]